MSQPINIVKLIEENPNTKLSKPYQSKLINKLKDSFSTEEQQLFISSFYCYLNYKSDDYVIDLDDIWRWLGYNKKQKAKELLENNFKLDIDYKKVFTPEGKNSKGGRPSDKFMLNIKTFKKMCLKASTSKANEIHEYYIKLEETLHEVIDEETNELRLQLEMKDEESNELKLQLEKKDEKINKLQRKSQVIKGKNVCYLCTADEKESEGIYTVGKTCNLQSRLNNYNDNKLFNFKIVYYISCKSTILMDAIENILLAKLNKYKIISTRDVFQLPEGKDVSFFTQYFDYLKIFCDDIEEDLVLEERTEEELNELKYEIFEENKESKSEYNREYRFENHDEILNKDLLRERTLDYQFNNRETLIEKQRQKASERTEEEKEKKKEYMKIYRKENAERIAESKKKYNEERKDVMEESINCACGSSVTRQNLSTHLNTDRHQKYLETGKTMNELRKEPSILCVCGMTISKRGLKRHKESKIHKSYIETNNIVEIE